MVETHIGFAQWQRQFEGRLLAPADDDYETSRRIWNGMVDKKPALIARCVSSADVRAAVKLARAEQMSVSVRGGGHGVAGTAVCDGGLMLDLSSMKEISIDSVSREATAAPGLLWGEFDRATQAHGLATTGGQISHTGIAGLTLGGGLGYLMGKHGATCDNLLSVNMVTADGEMLTASAERNADLFWAVRGAGANFGVVTSFRYRLHPLGEVLAGLLLHPRERALELIAFHREFLAGSPDELDTTIGFLNSPEGCLWWALLPFTRAQWQRANRFWNRCASSDDRLQTLSEPCRTLKRKACWTMQFRSDIGTTGNPTLSLNSQAFTLTYPS